MLTIKWKKGYLVEYEDGIINAITREMGEKSERYCRGDAVRLVVGVMARYDQHDRIALAAGMKGFIVGIRDPDETRVEDVLLIQLFDLIQDGRPYAMNYMQVERTRQ